METKANEMGTVEYVKSAIRQAQEGPSDGLDTVEDLEMALEEGRDADREAACDLARDLARRLRDASAILRSSGAPRLVPGRRDMYLERGMQPIVEAIEKAFGGCDEDVEKDAWEASYDMLADVFDAAANAAEL